eukprot:CAMPEP_0197644680 /NCGR_PEP_ID=MMETSP1338-20131121/17579_1 /TAXON_ID=43686 ORGANISM="Pelagodinium beii, Strain RCC1491" /NCGR_SAMPLE_ID=MMETSP1338 /ASSEMBLY_ACC=CAM_ASM_000754 /LENGTH=140 /DNA_ID=CAMNT_0043218117 /DNA_START=59 /DNA_END=477 /DNA_ORIENTATION=+
MGFGSLKKLGGAIAKHGGAIAGALGGLFGGHDELDHKGPPTDPDDLTPPDELATALSIFAKQSALPLGAASRAAAYARAQAEIAESLARTASKKLDDLSSDSCVKKLGEQMAALRKAQQSLGSDPNGQGGTFAEVQACCP